MGARTLKLTQDWGLEHSIKWSGRPLVAPMNTRLIYYYVKANFGYFVLKLTVVKLHHPFLQVSICVFYHEKCQKKQEMSSILELDLNVDSNVSSKLNLFVCFVSFDFHCLWIPAVEGFWNKIVDNNQLDCVWLVPMLYGYIRLRVFAISVPNT
jgi:hypothetical protein